MQENIPLNVIRPPSEIRDIIKKTAWYVSKKGLEFEFKIKENELNNVKFSFLNSNDPYHDYYIHYRTSLFSRNYDDSSLPRPAIFPTTTSDLTIEKPNFTNYVLSLVDIDNSLIASLHLSNSKNRKFNFFLQMSHDFYSRLMHPNTYKLDRKSVLISFLTLSRQEYMNRKLKPENGRTIDVSNLSIVGYVDSYDFDLNKSSNALMKNDLLGISSEERSKIFNKS